MKLYTSHNTNTLLFDEVTEKKVETRAHGDAKYAYFVDQVTWEEAKAACNAIVEGDTTAAAQLASIFSKGARGKGIS